MPDRPTAAALLRTALNSGDTRQLAALFHPDVRFHPAGPAEPATQGRDQALSWYDDRRVRGIRTQVEETFTYPDAVVLALRISAPTDPAAAPALVYRLFRLAGDHVTHIRDFTERPHALTAADRPVPRPH